MKKLIKSLDHVDNFTKDLIIKRNKEFFHRVQKTEAYYHPEEWELDYQKQVSLPLLILFLLLFDFLS